MRFGVVDGRVTRSIACWNCLMEHMATTMAFNYRWMKPFSRSLAQLSGVTQIPIPQPWQEPRYTRDPAQKNGTSLAIYQPYGGVSRKEWRRGLRVLSSFCNVVRQGLQSRRLVWHIHIYSFRMARKEYFSGLLGEIGKCTVEQRTNSHVDLDHPRTYRRPLLSRHGEVCTVAP